MALAPSNNVVNDWMRKIPDSIFNHEGKKQEVKVLRIGNPDLCDENIFDLFVEIRVQRKFFRTRLSDADR